MLTKDVYSSINESTLCWLATVDKDGLPNVSPKEMFSPLGENNLIIANIASPGSVSNISSNPNVCVSFVHIFKQKGFKLAGTAKIITKDDLKFDELTDKLSSLGCTKFEIKSVINIKVNKVSPIIAPSYWAFPNTTESSLINQAMNTYGVSPKGK